MINIVMVARDRDKLTQQALNSLYAHTDWDKFNITLVDDGSDAPVFVQQSVENACAIHIHRSHHVLGAIKNLGVYWSEHHFGRGEWLYLSDNDVYFQKYWLNVLMVSMDWCEDKGLRLLGGQNHPYHQPVEKLVGDMRETAVNEYQSLAGTSWLMRWDTWDKYGPLEETHEPGVCKGEDHEFCQRIRRDGFKVGAVWPHVVLDTGITQTGGTMSPGHEIKQRVQGIYYE